MISEYIKSARELSSFTVMESSSVTSFANPPEEFQKKFCGSSMLDAYLFAASICNIIQKKFEINSDVGLSDVLTKKGHVLDFGVGWGRVARLFAHRFDARRIFGVDVNSTALAMASAALPNATFNLINGQEKLCFRDDLFNLVYSISVFSHLGKNAQKMWAEEISRVLAPGGVAIVTYHGPWLIDIIERPELRNGSPWHEALSQFSSASKEIRESWDEEGFYFLPSGGEPSSSKDVYGDALASQRWVSSLWAECGVSLVEWIEDRSVYPQCVAVLIKND